MANILEKLDDLLSIEINTIRKAGMSARRPPIFPWQLMEIIDIYLHYLEGLQICTDFIKTPNQNLFNEKELKKLEQDDADNNWWHYLEQKVLEPENKAKFIRTKQTDTFSESGNEKRFITNDWSTFDKIRIVAKYAYAEQMIVDEEQRIMLIRIRRNCDLIKGILRKLSGKKKLKNFINVDDDQLNKNLQNEPFSIEELDFDHITTVRKIWEIGTESVVIQTVIQVEGDVITRITPQLMDKQYSDEIRNALFTVHRNSMDVGLSHWKNLIGTLIELVKNLSPKSPWQK